MNPEFVRNLWLELTPRRMAFVLVTLGLVFFAVIVASGTSASLFAAALWLYYLFAVWWGTHSAAMAVVSEIRDRTWDLQRLSAIGAGTMTWGKLFGATIHNWFGAAICLGIMMSTMPVGGLAGVIAVGYLLLVGVISQATALLASLIAAARRQSHTRLEVYVYQLAGVAVAAAVWALWQGANPAGAVHDMLGNATVVWWGHAFRVRAFLLTSLAIFTTWTLVACYRAMRIELRMQNGPWVWLAWLLFIGVYVAGFDGWLVQDGNPAKADAVGRRLAIGTSVYVGLTYVMGFLEPKDRVLYRWLVAELGAGRVGPALAHLQAWMTSYAATVLLAVALMIRVGSHGGSMMPDPLSVIAALGFLTRDVGILVLMQTLPGRRGDVAAIVTLFALYVLIPSILHGLGLDAALPLFYPARATPPLLGAIVAWAEGTLTFMAAGRRVGIDRRAATAAG